MAALEWSESVHSGLMAGAVSGVPDPRGGAERQRENGIRRTWRLDERMNPSIGLTSLSQNWDN